VPCAAGDGGGDKHDDCDYDYRMKMRKEELEKEGGKKNNITGICVPRILQYEHSQKLMYRIVPSCTPKCLEY